MNFGYSFSYKSPHCITTLKTQLGGEIAMNKEIAIVQETLSAIYHLDIKRFNASQNFDQLFKDRETFKIRELKDYNIPTAGHMPVCLSMSLVLVTPYL